LTTSKNTSASKRQAIDYEQLGRMLANIYETGYINRNQAYKMSFLKGILAGFGGVVGATLVVAIVLALLSLFTDLPIVGPLLNPVQDTLQSEKR
jgi:hypothetical protein